MDDHRRACCGTARGVRCADPIVVLPFLVLALAPALEVESDVQRLAQWETFGAGSEQSVFDSSRRGVRGG